MREESGSALVGAALLIALISAIAIVAASTISDRAADMYMSVVDSLPDEAPLREDDEETIYELVVHACSSDLNALDEDSRYIDMEYGEYGNGRGQRASFPEVGEYPALAEHSAEETAEFFIEYIEAHNYHWGHLPDIPLFDAMKLGGSSVSIRSESPFNFSGPAANDMCVAGIAREIFI